jgi:hypothetical protein
MPHPVPWPSPHPNPAPTRRVRWGELYREAELYKAALRVYTKSLFQWRKALSRSRDGRTLYDFSRHGARNLEALHGQLRSERFHFRAGAARRHSFNGKVRTLFIYPWEERIVDLLLYRLLNRQFHRRFSPACYAYRWAGYGVDLCQRRVASLIARLPKPLFLVKRDIANYFPSIDHGLLLDRVAELVDPGDYLWRVLEARIRFEYEEAGRILRADRGVPFGTPIACFFANLYLAPLDERLARVQGLAYFRYADDLLGIAADPGTAARAAAECDAALAALGLAAKPSHSFECALSDAALPGMPCHRVTRFRHLGLEFRADGRTGLSRDKSRKICNLFRYAFRRRAGRLRRLGSPEGRAQAAVAIARGTLEQGVRNVAIIDYYLKHVRDEAQLRRLDRWLAEEVLSIAFRNGHKKGNFGRLTFGRLRAMGLPSLLHRSRLIRHGHVQTSFFRWQECRRARRARGDGARLTEPFPQA